MAKETNKTANDETKQNDASSGEQTVEETGAVANEQSGNSSSEQTNAQATGTESADAQSGGIISGIFDAVSSVVSSVAETVSNVAETAVNVVTTGTTDGSTAEPVKANRRAQKIGTVTSDKMTKTVVVNVDRQIMHPKYRRYVRRRTKFMAHDEMGAGIGDKVRIEETRPLSARKRWRVIEIVQKAAR